MSRFDRVTLENLDSQYCSEWLRGQIKALLEENAELRAAQSKADPSALDILRADPTIAVQSKSDNQAGDSSGQSPVLEGNPSGRAGRRSSGESPDSPAPTQPVGELEQDRDTWKQLATDHYEVIQAMRADQAQQEQLGRFVLRINEDTGKPEWFGSGADNEENEGLKVLTLDAKCWDVGTVVTAVRTRQEGTK